jgi:hypothetical protein
MTFKLTRRELLCTAAGLALFPPSVRDFLLASGPNDAAGPNDDTLRAVVNTARFVRTPEDRKRYAGLAIAVGIAQHYASDRINGGARARREFDSLIRSGMISDPAIIKGMTNALQGKLDSEELNSLAEDAKRVYGAVGAVVGLFHPGAGVAVTQIGEWGPSIADALLDPNSPVALYPQPRLDPILAAGAFSFKTITDQVEATNQTAALVRDYLTSPTGLNIRLTGDPLADVDQLSQGDRDFIQNAIIAARNHSAADFKTALTGVADKLFAEFDKVNATSAQLLMLMKDRQKKEEAEQKARESEAHRRFIQNEIAGGISIVSNLASLVFGDPQLGKQISGVYDAVSGAASLISSFSAGSIGVFALTGGIGNIASGLFGLFGPSQNDFLIAQLNRLEQKIDALIDIVKQGFEHIDKRLTEIQDLSLEILRELAVGNQQITSRLRQLDESLDNLSRFVRQTTWQERENAISQALLVAKGILSAPGQRHLGRESLATAVAAIARFQDECGQEPHAGRSLGVGTLSALADFVGARESVGYQIGFLPLVSSVMFVPTSLNQDRTPRVYPNPDRWCEVSQALLHLLALHSDQRISQPLEFVKKQWFQGAALRTDMVNVMLPDALEHAARRLEALSLRDRTCNGVATLEAYLDRVARSEAVAVNQNPPNAIIRLRNALETAEDFPTDFQELALALRFTLALHGWRLSADNGRDRYRLADAQLICCRKELAEFAVVAAADVTQDLVARHVNVEQNWPLVVDGIVAGFRKRMQEDLTRARVLAGTLRQMPPEERQRCGALDVVLRETLAFSTVHGIHLEPGPAPTTHLLHLSKLESARTVSPDAFKTYVKQLVAASSTEFASMIGENAQRDAGFVPLKNVIGERGGSALVRGGPNNAAGARSVARIDLPSPVNLEDADEQLELYHAMITGAFDHLEWDEYPPVHVEAHFPEEPLISRKLRNYYWAGDNGAPFVALLLARHQNGTIAVVQFKHQAEPITALDHSGTKVQLTLWAFTPQSCGFEL